MSADAPTNGNTNEPKTEPPKGLLDKIGAALPIALTALATVFAGMSTGALQQAMYWKGQAGQDQSKATNQWTLAGFKRDRALVMQTSAASLQVAAAGQKPEFTPDPKLESDKAALEKTALEWLGGKGPPRVYPRGADAKAREGQVGLPDLTVKGLPELLEMISTRKKEDDILNQARHVEKKGLNEAIDDAENASQKITEDEGWGKVMGAVNKLVADARKKTREPAKLAAILAANFELEQRRYRGESFLNQQIAALYEARVQTSTAESDKHRMKSQNLFIAMLVAQIGAVVSSVALGKKLRGGLWLLAAVVGLAALGVGGYAMLSSMQ
jgi:hypothetical protein